MNNQTQEALKMAVEVMEGRCAWGKSKSEVIAMCKEALEQPAQEPVLIQWYDEEEKEWENTDERYYKHYEEDGHKIRFLYTHPHQWQGLTDDEILKLKSMSDLGNWFTFARAIEQVLKEKNDKG